MKRTSIYMAFLLFFLPFRSLTCELCQQRQSKALRNIAHGTGPGSEVDYIIIWGAVIIVAVTLFLSIKYLVKPKEATSDHIKNITVH